PNVRQLSLEGGRLSLNTGHDHVDGLMALDRGVDQNHLTMIDLFPDIGQQASINLQWQNQLEDLVQNASDGRFSFLFQLPVLINAFSQLVLRLLSGQVFRDGLAKAFRVVSQPLIAPSEKCLGQAFRDESSIFFHQALDFAFDTLPDLLPSLVIKPVGPMNHLAEIRVFEKAAAWDDFQCGSTESWV